MNDRSEHEYHPATGVEGSGARAVRELFAGQGTLGSPANAALLDRLRGVLRDTKVFPAGLGREVAAAPPSIPEGDADPARYYAHLVGHVLPDAVNVGSPRCIAHMTTVVPEFVQELSHLLLAINQNLVKQEASGSFSALERETLAVMHRLVFDCPDVFYAQHSVNHDSSLGIFCSGGTLANLTALWIARNTRLGGDGAGIESLGGPVALERAGYRDAAIVGSALMHYSIRKAAGLLGIGEHNVHGVPVDERGRMVVTVCRQLLRRCAESGIAVLALVGVAGTTDCGSIDPLDEIADLAEEFAIHYHIDAAWGGPLLFSRSHRARLRGIERADSVTIDAHKQMYLPIGTSMLLLRDPQRARVVEKTSDYILLDGSGDLGRRSVEGSRPGNALFVHAALNIIGRRGYESLVDESIRRAAFMAEAIRRSPEFELLAEPETNIVLYRYLPPSARADRSTGRRTQESTAAINALNECLDRAQLDNGRSLVSRTILRHLPHVGRVVALRAVMANPFTTEDDVLAVLADQIAIAEGLQQS